MSSMHLTLGGAKPVPITCGDSARYTHPYHMTGLGHPIQLTLILWFFDIVGHCRRRLYSLCFLHSSCSNSQWNHCESFISGLGRFSPRLVMPYFPQFADFVAPAPHFPVLFSMLQENSCSWDPRRTTPKDSTITSKRLTWKQPASLQIAAKLSVFGPFISLSHARHESLIVYSSQVNGMT